MIPWKHRDIKTVHTSNKVLSKKSEARLAKTTNSKIQPASGALSHAKGDSISRDFLFEDKCTRADSFRVTCHLLDKLERQASQHNRFPAMRVQLSSTGRTVFILPERTFIEILQILEENDKSIDRP